MKKLYTKTKLIRMTPEMDKAIVRVAKQKKVDQSVFIRGAIEKSIPKWCACGRYWAHTGRHGIE